MRPQLHVVFIDACYMYDQGRREREGEREKEREKGREGGIER